MRSHTVLITGFGLLLSQKLFHQKQQHYIMQVGAFQSALRRCRSFGVGGRRATGLISSVSDLHSSNGNEEVQTKMHMKMQHSFFHTQSALLATAGPDSDSSKEKKKSKPKPKTKKIKLANPKNVNLDALSAAFDEMARKEGFDTSTSTVLRADDATFEDEFDYDELDMHLDMDDMEDGAIDIGDDGDDDFLDFGGGGDNESMEDRIAAAQQDMDLGRVRVSDELDAFSTEVTPEDLKKLGFKQEVNPFGDDETPRREAFQIITNAMTCPACGSDFQDKDEFKPGYLPPPKYNIQVKLSKIEDAQDLQRKADDPDVWSTEDEVEWLLQSGAASTADGDDTIDVNEMAEEMGLDLVKLAKKKVICKRCHGLQNFGEAPELLRPGWTEEPTLSQEKFRDLLLPLREKPAVILALVDLFDFSGSILPQLDEIAGDNPVIIAANKADLLSDKMGTTRAESWVRRELEYLGVRSIANVGGAVRLVSCKTGFGITNMLSKVRKIADDMECDIYVVGAANAGKSSLINHILEKNEDKSSRKSRGKKRPGNANKKKGAVTASPLPGTTLEFIKIDMGDGLSLYDTPGLLVPGTLTQRLTPAELKMVVPKKQVEPVTFRVGSGKCVLIGGLARIEVLGDTKPFLFTFYVSNDIKLHPTDVSKADDFIAKHAGALLTPPLGGPERLKEMGELEHFDVEIDGAGWKEAAADISLSGIGWVAVTGAGSAKVRISVPRGIRFAVRPPLMPFDVWETTAKYTGGRAVRKSTRTKAGKRNKGVGRR